MSDISDTDWVCHAQRHPLTSREQERLDALLRTSAETRFISGLLRGLDQESHVQRGDDALIARVAALTAQTRYSRSMRIPRTWLLAVAAILMSTGAIAGWHLQGRRIDGRTSTEILHATRLVKNTPQHGTAVPRRQSPDPDPIEQEEEEKPRPSTQRVTLPVSTVPQTISSPEAQSIDYAIPLDATVTAFKQQGVVTLFSIASLARREGRQNEAIATYQQILNQFPNSVEAVPSRLAMAKLLSETHPSEALNEFQLLLQGSTNLRPEALWGTIQVAQRLGQHEVARNALQELRASYPNCPYVDSARKLVDE